MTGLEKWWFPGKKDATLLTGIRNRFKLSTFVKAQLLKKLKPSLKLPVNPTGRTCPKPCTRLYTIVNLLT